MSRKSFREDSPTYQIGVTGKMSKRVFQKLLNEAGIDLSPEQVGLLNTLLEKDGSSMQELSTLNDRDNSATTRIIDNLQKKGFVIRKGMASDRRIWRIFITEKGKDHVIMANTLGQDYVARVVNGIEENELSIFMKVIKEIRGNISKI